MVAPAQMGEKEAHIDLHMTSPTKVIDLLGNLAELGKLNKDLLVEKFQRLQQQFPELKDPRVLNFEPGAEPVLGTPLSGDVEAPVKEPEKDSSSSFGNLKPSSMDSQKRKDRYQKFLLEKPPEDHGFSMKLVQDQVKSLRENRSQENLEDLEKQRRAFVEELFKKK
jgi:hypothetical protein